MFLYLIGIFDVPCVRPVWLRLTPFLPNVAKLFTNCHLPIPLSLLGEQRWPFILKLRDKSVCQNVQHYFIPG